MIGNPDTDGYVLSHPKLSDFLQSPDNGILDAAHIAETRQAFLQWCEMVLKSLDTGEVPEESPHISYITWLPIWNRRTTQSSSTTCSAGSSVLARSG